MAKMPFFQFYPHDWLYDTRILTDHEKGVLIDLLCFMWNSPKRGVLVGHPDDLARMVGKEWSPFSTTLDSLKRKGILDVSQNVTASHSVVTIMSRRMVREEKERESVRLRQRKHRQDMADPPMSQNVTRKKSEDRSQKTEDIKDLKTKEAPSAVVAFEIPPDLLDHAGEIKDWLEYKRQRGQRYKPKGLEAFFKQFRAIPKEKRRETVDHSMSNNWSGLFMRRDSQGGSHDRRNQAGFAVASPGKYAD